MKKLVLDLDYTLLDTVAFKDALVTATGVPKKEWESVYNDTVAKKGFFEPGAFFDALVAKDLLAGDAAPGAREAFEGVLKTTDRYLYPEAKEMLLALQKHKSEVQVDLMTFGEAKWQRSKVEHSGLAKLFDDVLYVETNKREFVRGLKKGDEEVIIVNDNGKEMDEMVEAAPEFTYIWKAGGPKAAPKEWRRPKVDTIADLAETLEKEIGIELRKEMREVREGVELKTVAPGENVRLEIEMGEDDEGDGSAPPPFDPATRGPGRR